MTHSLKRSNPFGDQEKEDENEAAEEEILSPNSKRRRINCEHDDRANVLPTVMEVMGGGSSRKTGHTSYDINDNWDREERVQVLLQRYEKARSEISGSDKWDEEQRKVHKLIYMRGEHPMLDYSWRYNFRMWGVDTGVYAPEGTKKQLAIRSLKSEFKGTSMMVRVPPGAVRATDLIYPNSCQGARGFVRSHFAGQTMDRS